MEGRLEEWLYEAQGRIMLLSLGKANLDVLQYLARREDMQIDYATARYMEKEDCLGLKAVVLPLNYEEE